MTIQEMFEKMKSGDITMHTELGTRDEHIQSRQFIERFHKLKIKTGINARALVMKDVVIPFNPFTCEADDIYNEKTPMRPILLVDQVIGMIKEYCRQDKELAAKWEKKLGGKLALDKKEPVKEDYILFKSCDFIKPRITTYHTVSVNIPENLGGTKFKQKYVVDSTKLNENMTYNSENAPVWHQLAVMFNSLIRPEWEAKKKKLEAASATQEQIQGEKQTMFAKSPVSFVNPTNLVPFIFIEHDQELPNIEENDFKKVESLVYFFTYTDKWITAFNELKDDNSLDENMNFYDLTIKTPKETDKKSDGTVYTDNDVLALYQAMTITVTDGRKSLQNGKTTVDKKVFENSEYYKPLLETISKYFEYSQEESSKSDGDTFEKIMAASNRFRPVSSIQDKLLPASKAIYEGQFSSSPYNTEVFKAANSKILIAMNPKMALELAALDDSEIKSAEDEQKQSVSELISELNEGTVIEADTGLEIAVD